MEQGVASNRALTGAPPARLGIRANRGQFLTLVTVNGFVGAMIGLERTVVPILAREQFGIASVTAALSFIATFGIAKALANMAGGRLADRAGRRRVLIAGWLAALPVPALVIWAPSWGWIVFANVFLGVSQGLCWSMTVLMKMDLAGPKRRGLALGINETAGYLALAATAFVTARLAESHGFRSAPFLAGFGIAACGLALSVFVVKETSGHVAVEAQGRATTGTEPKPSAFERRALTTAAQAGFVNNLNDALAWGVLPIFMAARGLSLTRIGVVAAVYPLSWGLCQIGFGAWSDRHGRKRLVVAGLGLQSISLLAFALSGDYAGWVVASLGMGVGTAMVYPILIAYVGDIAQPLRRGAALGSYRLWRDLGFAGGALLAGIASDLFNPRAAIVLVAAVTAASAAATLIALPEHRRN